MIGEEMCAIFDLGLKMRALKACFNGLALWNVQFNNCSFNCLLKTRVSRARDLHLDDRKSPDPLSVTKHLFFDLHSTLHRSHSKGMEIETRYHYG